MRKFNVLLLLLAIAAVTGCAGGSPATGTGAQLRARALTVNDYYADDAMRAQTREACSADSEALVDQYAAMPACQNASEAEKRHLLGRGPE